MKKRVKEWNSIKMCVCEREIVSVCERGGKEKERDSKCARERGGIEK